MKLNTLPHNILPHPIDPHTVIGKLNPKLFPFPENVLLFQWNGLGQSYVKIIVDESGEVALEEFYRIDHNQLMTPVYDWSFQAPFSTSDPFVTQRPWDAIFTDFNHGEKETSLIFLNAQGRFVALNFQRDPSCPELLAISDFQIDTERWFFYDILENEGTQQQVMFCQEPDGPYCVHFRNDGAGNYSFQKFMVSLEQLGPNTQLFFDFEKFIPHLSIAPLSIKDAESTGMDAQTKDCDVFPFQITQQTDIFEFHHFHCYLKIDHKNSSCDAIESGFKHVKKPPQKKKAVSLRASSLTDDEQAQYFHIAVAIGFVLGLGRFLYKNFIGFNVEKEDGKVPVIRSLPDFPFITGSSSCRNNKYQRLPLPLDNTTALVAPVLASAGIPENKRIFRHVMGCAYVYRILAQKTSSYIWRSPISDGRLREITVCHDVVTRILTFIYGDTTINTIKDFSLPVQSYIPLLPEFIPVPPKKIVDLMALIFELYSQRLFPTDKDLENYAKKKIEGKYSKDDIEFLKSEHFLAYWHLQLKIKMKELEVSWSQIRRADISSISDYLGKEALHGPWISTFANYSLYPPSFPINTFERIRHHFVLSGKGGIEKIKQLPYFRFWLKRIEAVSQTAFPVA